MKVKLIWTIILILLLSSLGGCSKVLGPDDGEDKAVLDGQTDHEPIVLTVLSTAILENPEGEVFRMLTDEFMALNPDIVIEFEAVPMNSASTTTINASIEGKLPDLYVNYAESIYKFYDLDIATDLNDYLDKAYIDGFYDNLIDEVTIDGQMMFLPWFTTAHAVIYRKDWFEAKNLEVPVTWDDFLAVALALTEDLDGDDKHDRWGLAMIGTKNNSGAIRFTNILRSFGAYEVREANGEWDTDLDSEAGIEALQFFGDLYTKYKVVPIGPLEVSYSEAITQMSSGQTAMMITGSHSIGAILKENPELEGKLGSFLIPKKDHHTSTLGIQGYSISKDSPNKEAAIEYLKFLLLKENQLRWHEATGRMPSRKDAGEEIRDSELFAGFTEALDYVEPIPRVTYYDEMPSILGEAYQSVLTETVDAKTAAIKAATRVRQSIVTTK